MSGWSSRNFVCSNKKLVPFLGFYGVLALDRLSDRASALAQWDRPLADALAHEGAQGAAVVLSEGLAGAARFAAGAGRHGRPAD